MELLLLIITGVVGYFWLKKKGVDMLVAKGGELIDGTGLKSRLSFAVPKKSGAETSLSEAEDAAWAQFLAGLEMTSAQRVGFNSRATGLSLPLSIQLKVLDVSIEGDVSLRDYVKVYRPLLSKHAEEGIVEGQFATNGSFSNGAFANYQKNQTVLLNGIIEECWTVFTEENHMFGYSVSEVSFDGHKLDEPITAVRMMGSEEVKGTRLCTIMQSGGKHILP